MNGNYFSSIFSFCLCKEGMVKGELLERFEISRRFGDYILYTDSRTPVDYAESDGRELAVFGYAVDVFSGKSDGLAKAMLDSAADIDGVVKCEEKLGGKYVVFYAENGKCFCLGDATCSVPLFYGNGVCTCYTRLIAQNFELEKDPYLRQIRDSGKLAQPMPYDTTPYKEIKRLLPNHYLDMDECRSVRFINSSVKQKRITAKQAADITSPMVENITKMFDSKFKLYCPLTGGKDSRVIYAYLKNLSGENVDSYTVWFDRFEADGQDWDIPVELAKQGKTSHKQVRFEIVSNDAKAAMDDLLEADGYSPEAFSLALTLYEHFSDGAILEGDILGQIGKNSLHRNIPARLASPSYFRCKIHNFSEGAKHCMKEWMDDVKASYEQVNIMDLFSVENRLGVWAANTHLVRNGIGLVNLNVFNSRSIIYVWTAADKKERMKSMLHFELIKIICPDVLHVPFGQDKGFMKFAKSSVPIFYFSTFLKYYIQKRNFR